MKKLISLVLATFVMTASAGEYKEVYTQYTETVQIVLTNQPCLKWEAPQTHN